MPSCISCMSVSYALTINYYYPKHQILGKTDLKLIHRLTYKCIIFNDAHFEIFLVRLCTFVVLTISRKACLKLGEFLYVITSI